MGNVQQTTRAKAPRQGEMVATDTTRSRRSRAQARIRHSASRAIVIWIVAGIVLSQSSRPEGDILGLSVIFAVVYLACLQSASKLARQMPLAFGVWIVAALGAMTGLASLSAVGFWVDDFTQEELILISALTFLATGMWDEFVRRKATAPLRVVIVGAAEPFTDMVSDIAAGGEGSGFKLVGVAAESVPVDVASLGVRVVDLEHLSNLVEDVKPDLIVVAVAQGRPAVFAQLLTIASTTDFTVVGVPEFYEVAFGRLPVRALTAAWFMSTLHFYNRPYNRISKRSFDVVAASCGLIIAAPILPLIAIIVKRTPGPLLYRQQRLGEHGREFSILKFRSMRVDAEADGAVFASKKDPRIIPGGKLLRLLRIDEIPQLWNVIRGDMSMVGPRPERPEFLELLAEQVPYWTQRELLKPGLTGWAQIRAGYASDSLGAEAKLSYDLWYLRHRSLLLDAVICLKTVVTVATASGSR